MERRRDKSAKRRQSTAGAKARGRRKSTAIPTLGSDSAIDDEVDEVAIGASRDEFCKYLVSARERSGKTLEEIATKTRIPRRSLERLETGDFEALPADVFVRGFLRSYARCVGLDGAEAIKRYSTCGMTPAPVASPMADELASSMATLESSSAPNIRASVRPLRAPAPEPGDSKTDVSETAAPERAADAIAEPATVSDGHSDDGHSDVSSREQHPAESRSLPRSSQPEVAPAEAPSAPTERASSNVPSEPVATSASGPNAPEVGAAPSRVEKPKPEPESQKAAPGNELSGSASGSESGESRASNKSRNARKRARKRKKRKGNDGAHAASKRNKNKSNARADRSAQPKGPESAAAIGDMATDTDDSAANASATSAPAKVDRQPSAPVETAATARDSERPPAAKSSEAKSPAADPSKAAMRTGKQSPILVIDDADPESAERERAEREQVREEGAGKSFVPPSLLDSEQGSRRGALTLAVIILVIVATLTMSYLMRQPDESGDGVTRATPASQHTLVG